MFEPNEILVYLRKSRSDDPILSVEEVLHKHETILDEWSVQYLDAIIPETNKYREVVSGETIDDRPEIQKVLRMIETPKIKAILVVEVQRLSRGDLEDAGRLIKLLRYTNTFVITPQKTYDLRDEYDRDIFERELKRGNEFLEYQKKIMSRGRLLSVSQGNFIASVPPYGYNKTWIMDGKRKCPTLEENKEQADVVRLIFDLYVNKDLGYQRICNTLDDMKITPPKGDYWSPAALKDMLTNIHYIGKVKWNWRKTVTIVEDSEIVKTRPKSRIGEYLVYEGKHAPILDEELFNAAQDKLGKNNRAPAFKAIRNPFASILFCKSCGKAMSLRFYNRKDGTERCSPRLLCDNTHCNTGSCTFDEMINRVCDILEQCIADYEVRLSNGDNNSAKLHATLIKNLEKKLKDLQAKELSQWEAQSDPNIENRMPQEIFKQLNAKLLKEKDDVQQALYNAYESMPEPINYEDRIIKFKDGLDALRDTKKEASEQNRLLKEFIDRIDYKRESPQRLTKKQGEKKGTRFKSSGGHWSNPPIEIDVKLKV
jgi:hypothetical protein